MGKTRGHGTRRGGSKGRPSGPGRGRPGEEEGSSCEDEQFQGPRPVRGQASTVGMLPPSDSEEEEEDGGGDKGKEPAAAAKAKDKDKEEADKPKPKPKPAGQSKTAGKLPASSSEDEEESSDDDDEDSDEPPKPVHVAAQAAARRKKTDDEEVDPAQVQKDMERLEMIKHKREVDRLKRIKDEGWDRFAPVSDTNKPPGSIPSDHPSVQE